MSTQNSNNELKKIIIVSLCSVIVGFIISWSAWITKKSFQVDNVITEVEAYESATRREFDHTHSQLELLLSTVEKNHRDLLSLITNTNDKLMNVIMELKIPDKTETR